MMANPVHDDPRNPSRDPDKPSPSVHTVGESGGMSLAEIAKHYYGNDGEYYWNKIYEANKQTMKDPGDLKAGDKIIIPQLPPTRDEMMESGRRPTSYDTPPQEKPSHDTSAQDKPKK